jgi:signal transduction histidine kinase/DNA-binding response OmpR family regulator
MTNDKVDILLVDDRPENLLVLETLLAELDESILTVPSGAEALRRVLERDFAVILLDVNMPGMDGFETAALIRGRKRSALTPIIFLTAFADEVHKARAYELGAVDFILTPIVPEVLRTKVKVFIDLFRLRRQIERQAEERIALASEQAARAMAEESTRRFAFLAGASKVLNTSLEEDHQTRARGLLHLVVPLFSDFSALSIVNENGSALPIMMAYVDAANGRQFHVQAADESLHPALTDAAQRVLESKELERLESIAAEPAIRRRPSGATEGEATVGPDFALTSALVLPLVARGKLLGVLTLAVGASARTYSEADVALASDLAGRASIALDNARLHRSVKESDQRKNEFLAMLAHELRNPLAPIRNACHILGLDRSLNPQTSQARDIIERQVQHVVRLVDDLLDVSRITQNKIQLQIAPVDVSVAVVRAVEMSKPLIDSKRHQLMVTLSPQPLLVNADLLRLAQVLTNLLNNAAKYTPEGGRISISVAREGRQAVFRVRDSGIGIRADMLASVFDLFTQAERALDRSQGGLGIGLTLVKSLVDLHGGKVQAFSAGLNQGSEFVVHLPVLDRTPRTSAPKDEAAKIEPSVSRRVLVVDDHVDAAKSLATLVTAWGHDVRLAHTGPAALEVAAAFAPQLVLLDIGLPGMDGYEVAERIRRDLGMKDTLVAALTGYGQDEDRQRSQQVGIDVHLVKPIDLDILQKLLTRPEGLRTDRRFSLGAVRDNVG